MPFRTFCALVALSAVVYLGAHTFVIYEIVRHHVGSGNFSGHSTPVVNTWSGFVSSTGR